ncbi:MAG TPA: hypothetical protein DEF59_02530 [Candidatus Magasanikbacteria bacterium]|nr:hypothetical protein [Candidatus Magasanikbacteria bacterium]
MVIALIGAWLILVVRVDVPFMWYLGLGIGTPIIVLDLFRAYYVWPRVTSIRQAKQNRRHTFLRDEQFLKNFERFYEPLLTRLYHPSEMGKISSGVWYFLGMIVSYGIASVIGRPWLAGFAILFQGIADPIARTFGLRWPVLPIPEWGNKSVGGFLAAFFVSAGAGMCILAIISPATFNISVLRLVFCIGVGAFFAALAEANARRIGLDDNLIIPVVAVIGMIAALR